MIAPGQVIGYLTQTILFFFTEKNRVKCTVCNKEIEKQSIERHMCSHQSPGPEGSGIRPYQCMMCDRSCKSKNNLANHLYNVHIMEERKPWQCRYCSYRSAIKYNVHKHIDVQHPGKPHLVNQLEEVPTVSDCSKFLSKPADDQR